MKVKITILGCGNSTGVPAIGNYWGACDPAEAKNRRMRCSIAVQSEATTLVIDTGPDFREQLTRADIPMIDAALFTHEHGDHVNGIDELRILAMRRKNTMPIYANKTTVLDLEQRFHYLFVGGASLELYPPTVQSNVIGKDQYGKPMQIGDLAFTPFEQDHGTCQTLGYRFGDFGYSVDIVNLDDKAIKSLQGVKTWVVDGAGYNNPPERNKVHAGLQRIYDLNEKIGAAQVYITSLSLSMDYQTVKNELRAGYLPAYDGLVLSAEI